MRWLETSGSSAAYFAFAGLGDQREAPWNWATIAAPQWDALARWLHWSPVSNAPHPLWPTLPPALFAERAFDRPFFDRETLDRQHPERQHPDRLAGSEAFPADAWGAALEAAPSESRPPEAFVHMERAATFMSDPLLPRQWNLTDATLGVNAPGAWADYDGRGIRIAIVDDGFDYRHADLRADYDRTLDYDFRDRDADAFNSAPGDNHGTAVAGLIGADANGIGLVGVAHDATFTGFRVGFGAATDLSAIADALARGRTVDVVNSSWGFGAFADDFKNPAFAASAKALVDGAALGRGGLGTTFVFAAGNGRATGDNVNYHNFQNSPYTIAVAATGSDGRVASFSTPGAALLVSAPGVAVITTDASGAAGYLAGDYVHVSGTSFAAPTVAGVIALMLQANPKLGYRDVQDILAYSAKQTDAGSPGWKFNGAKDWNGGGLHFSHDYGFGLVDATAAVRLAETWTAQSTFANMQSLTIARDIGATITDASWIRSHFPLAGALATDAVTVSLDISHARVSDLTVLLTSPSGTVATLVAKPASGTGSGLSFTTTANNFRGENSQGTWTLTVVDNAAGVVGKLNAWSLTVSGDAGSANDVYVYTDEFGHLWTSARSVLSDKSGYDTINLAAVTSATMLDLRPGSAGIVAGKPLKIDATTVIEAAWLGDGDDFIIGNDAANMIHGGRGNDVIVGGKGADILWGGPGNDTFVYEALSCAGDTIKDFSVGSDTLDFGKLLASVGYRGSDPFADAILVLDPAAHGTHVRAAGLPANSHLVFLENVQAEMLHASTGWWV